MSEYYLNLKKRLALAEFDSDQIIQTLNKIKEYKKKRNIKAHNHLIEILALSKASQTYDADIPNMLQ